MYHVMNRGDRREDIFQDGEDRKRFLSTLGEACKKTEWEVHSYCLMRNHFHLVIETPQPNLVAGMKWLLPATLYASFGCLQSRIRRQRRMIKGKIKVMARPAALVLAIKIARECTRTCVAPKATPSRRSASNDMTSGNIMNGKIV